MRKEISLAARIVAVADVYAALIADRVYRPALSTEDATERGKLGYTVKKAGDRDALILEAGYTVDNCPTDFKLLYKHLKQLSPD